MMAGAWLLVAHGPRDREKGTTVKVSRMESGRASSPHADTCDSELLVQAPRQKECVLMGGAVGECELRVCSVEKACEL